MRNCTSASLPLKAGCGPLMLLLILLLPAPAYARWPTTLQENLPVAANPALWEEDPIALPYPAGSTLVVFWQEGLGNSYQIIDRYGNPVYSTPQQLIVGPAHPEYSPQVIPDGSGGAFAAWARTPNGPTLVSTPSGWIPQAIACGGMPECG